MIAQLLVTEGFATVEDVAYVDAAEIAAIEGFDEDTAEEIQARARDFLDKEAAEYDAKRRELGVEDGLLEIEGVTLPMAVALGEGEVKTVEDLAGLVPDDLRGWFETKDGERVREPGILEAFGLSRRGRRGADHARPRGRGLDRAASPSPNRSSRTTVRGREVTAPKPRPRPRPTAPERAPTTGRAAERGAQGRSRARTLAAAARERRDIVSGEVMDEARLIRFVAGPDGGRGPGPGAQAAGAGPLGRRRPRVGGDGGARRASSPAPPRPSSRRRPTSPTRWRACSTRRLLVGLGLARRAGELTSGFEKVSAAHRGGQGRLADRGADGAADGRRKLLRPGAASDRRRRRCSASSPPRNWVWPWAAENVIHTAFLAGRAAERWTQDVERLSGFRPLLPESWREEP